MKEEYVKPVMEVVSFEAEDIIMTSGNIDDGFTSEQIN